MLSGRHTRLLVKPWWTPSTFSVVLDLFAAPPYYHLRTNKNLIHLLRILISILNLLYSRCHFSSSFRLAFFNDADIVAIFPNKILRKCDVHWPILSAKGLWLLGGGSSFLMRKWGICWICMWLLSLSLFHIIWRNYLIKSRCRLYCFKNFILANISQILSLFWCRSVASY